MRFFVLIGYVTIFFIMSGCGRLQDLFRSPAADQVYSQNKRKTRNPVIKYLQSEEDTNASFLSRLKIKVDDELLIRFLNLPNELGSESKETNVQPSSIVDFEGNISLLVVGRVQVLGLTTLEVRKKLEKLYAHYYKDPQIEVRMTNRKVLLLGEGTQKVIFLKKERTHLIEALAEAGGIPGSAKPRKIKIIRGSYTNPDIIWVDITKLESLQDPILYLQPDDIIYVQPKLLIAFTREIQPLIAMVTLVSFSLNIYQIIRLISTR